MVKLFVGVTDKSWFEMLRSSGPLDEVNFWQPSGTREFKALEAGELFLFKLHSPDDFVVGGGVFHSSSNVPLSVAWEAFGFKNGVRSLSEMRERIARYRRDLAIADERSSPVIGCRVLTQPFFWPRELWMKVPASWASNIVTGKGFQGEDRDGRYLWDGVTERLTAAPPADMALDAARYGKPALIKPRLGQGAFRLSVTDNYDRRCAITDEKTLPILDAAHIRSYAAGGSHEPSNGLLMRTDIHRLFDLGYVTVAPDGRFVVSSRLKADFNNGRHYYDLQGTMIRAPRNKAPPIADALTWHRENCFLG